MAATAELTITLPVELVEIVRAKVAEGAFANESAYIESVLDSSLAEHASEEDLEQWLRTTGVQRYDAYDADPSAVHSAAQVLHAVRDRLRQVTANK